MCIGAGTPVSSYDDGSLAGRRPFGSQVQRRFVCHSIVTPWVGFPKVPDCLRDCKPTWLLLAPILHIFAIYSSIVLLGSTSDDNRIWWIVTSESLVLVGISFVPVARDNELLSKTANLKIFSNLYGVLILLRECLIGLFEQFGSYMIVRGTTLDPVLAYLSFRRILEVLRECTCPSMDNPFLPVTGIPETLSPPDQQMHKREWNAAVKSCMTNVLWCW